MEIENTQENKETSPINIPTNNQELETDGSSKKAIIGLLISLIPYIIFILILLKEYISPPANIFVEDLKKLGFEDVTFEDTKTVINPIFVWIQYIIPILVWIPCSMIYYLFFRKEQKGKNILIGTMLNITPILCFISALIARPSILLFLAIFITLEIILFSILNDKRNGKKAIIGLWILRIPIILFILTLVNHQIYHTGGSFEGIEIIIIPILASIPCTIIYYLFFKNK